MPSSMMSAHAPGSARRIAREVSGSGSPAVMNVTRAARPCCFSSAKRRSIRVALMFAAGCSCSLVRCPCLSTTNSIPTDSSFSLFAAPAPAHRGEANIDRAQHQDDERTHQLYPFFVCHRGPRLKQPDTQEIRDIGGRDDDQKPSHEFLEADHSELPRCRSSRSAAPPLQILRNAGQVLV